MLYIDFVKIAILSFVPLNVEPKREAQLLKTAAEARGHEAEIYHAGRFQVDFFEDEVKIFYDGRPFEMVDLVIPRARMITEADRKLAILKQFELMGVPVLNTYESIVVAKNKMRSLQIFQEASLAVPRTVLLEGKQGFSAAVERLGGYPVVLKDPFGTYGRGVILVESERSARSVLDMIWASWWPQLVMVQEFVSESAGRDKRVFVVKGKVVAAMERSAPEGDFRSNIELGGEGRAVELSEEEEALALKAVELLNLDVAGVDLIQSDRGPLVLEVNANPGFKALSKITGVDVAGAIVDVL